MAVKIRLRKLGRTHNAFFRVVVADSRSPRDGRCIEEVGYYNPITEIYTSCSDLISLCHKCKKPGHISKNCPLLKNNNSFNKASNNNNPIHKY